MFKDSFKYYKSRNRVVDFSTVVDFNNNTEKINYKLKKINHDKGITFFGFKPTDSWEVYEFIDQPGLIFIKDPFTSLGQRYWVVRCLQDYSKKPNKRNIDSLPNIEEVEDWWRICNSKGNMELLKKLRWSTLGYHHDWDTKVYSEESKTDFPDDLQKVTSFLSDVLGFGDYSAEAAIINYYHMDSTLSGHTDHSEPNLEAPLFSFSFGQTALFLIGGRTIEEPAIPVFLRSGDIIVMAGNSRLCYHGVPKILPTDIRPWEEIKDDKHVPIEYIKTANICTEEHLWKPFQRYLVFSRINMNVRQVLNKNQLTLQS